MDLNLTNKTAVVTGASRGIGLATVRATRAALPSLIERRGAIVNISSTLARMPRRGTRCR